MTRDPDWTETALRVTGCFETKGDPFAGVAGDFDGQGISLGALQWNIGQGTLQPLVKGAGQTALAALMPVYGEALWAAIHAPIPKGLEIVRFWQSAGRLRADILRELGAFAASPEMRREQIAAASHVADAAFDEATRWVTARGTAEPTKKEFCWFFDLVTQNGGLKGLRLADVHAFIAQSGNAADAICDWLKAQTAAQFGFRDCRRNTDLWRARVSAGDLDLFVLSYLRAMKAAPPSQGIVLNRKGTLALGGGWVNGSRFDFGAFD